MAHDGRERGLDVSTAQLLLRRESLHELVREIRKGKLLVAHHANVASVIEISLFIIDRLLAMVTTSNLVLHAKVKREDPLVVDLEQHWVGTIVSNFFAQWCTGSRKVEEIDLIHAVTLARN